MNYLARPQQILREEPPPHEAVDLRWFIARRFRRVRLISAVAAATLAIGAAVTLLAAPVYSSSALVLLLPQGGDDGAVGPRQDLAPIDASLVESEIEVLRSRVLARRLVDKLGLATRVDPILPSAFPFAAIFPAKPAADRTEHAVNEIMAATQIKRRRTSYAIDVGFNAAKPADAAFFANTLTGLYLGWQSDMRIERAGRANAWLSERLKVLQQEVAAKEKAAEDYRAANGLLSVDGSSTLTNQQMREMQAAHLQASTDLAEKRARLEQVEDLIRAGGSVETISVALSSPVIGGLREREADAARKESEMLARYGERHPDLLKIRAERQNVATQISNEIARIRANLKNEVAFSTARLSNLSTALNGVRGELVENNTSMVRQRELERDASATRSVYEDYLKRFQEITDQASLKVVDAQVVASAVTPATPSGPGRLIRLALWICLAPLLGVAIAWLADLVEDRLTDADDVETQTGASVLASLPFLKRANLRPLMPSARNPAEYVVEYPMSRYAEAFRVLRGAIRREIAGGGAPVVAISSPLAEEGKTTVALCLARVCAAAGERVLLIDADLRVRSLTMMTVGEDAYGMSGSGSEQGSTGLIKDPRSEADIAPASAEPALKNFFGGDKFDGFLKAVRNEYDLVILDCPPLLVLADGATIASKSDATIIVARAERSPARAVRKAIKQVQLAGGLVLGVALNGVMKADASSYGYGGAYYRSQKRYFAA